MPRATLRQVEIDLIGLAPGDPVVVCIEEQLAPCLVDGFGGIAGAVREAMVAKASASSSTFSASRFACLVSMKETSLPV